jgi:hypothetical protein
MPRLSRPWRFSAGLATLVVAAGITVTAADPAAASNHWALHNTATAPWDGGPCLDANTANINTNGDNIQLWSCSYAANQQWYWGAWGGSGLTIVNSASGLCLDADNNHINTPGDTVQLWSCWLGANQQWQVVQVHGSAMEEVVNIASGMCLDANPAGISSNGDTVRMEPCTGAANQLWHFEYL